MQSGRQPPFVRIVDYRVVRALAGCGRHCATLITQQTNGFNRCETESLSAFDLQVMLCFSALWHCNFSVPISSEGSLSWCAYDMRPEVRPHLSPDLTVVVSQHAREGCGRRCAILFASEHESCFGQSLIP